MEWIGHRALTQKESYKENRQTWIYKGNPGPVHGKLRFQIHFKHHTKAVGEALEELGSSRDFTHKTLQVISETKWRELWDWLWGPGALSVFMVSDMLSLHKKHYAQYCGAKYSRSYPTVKCPLPSLSSLMPPSAPGHSRALSSPQSMKSASLAALHLTWVSLKKNFKKYILNLLFWRKSPYSAKDM